MLKDDGWVCRACSTRCFANEVKCAACEAFRPDVNKADWEREQRRIQGIPDAVFGAPSTSSNDTPLFGRTVPLPSFSKKSNGFLNAQPLDPFGSTAPVTFGAPPPREPIAPKVRLDGGRFTFGRSIAEDEEESMAATPSKSYQSPATFCAVMETPILRPGSDSPVLGGIDTNFKIDSRLPKTVSDNESGSVYTWGSGECEQLPVRLENMEDGLRKTPIIIKALTDPNVLKIACGAMHSLAILGEGKKLFSWGCNDDGALGRPTKVSGSSENIPSLPANAWQLPPEDSSLYISKVPSGVWGIPRDREFKRVSAGDSHSAAITTVGECYAWGCYRDFYGPVGYMNSNSEIVEKQVLPSCISGIKGVAMDLVSGENHTVVLTYSSIDKKKRIYLWGANDFGQLGSDPPGSELTERTAHLIPREWTIEEFKFKQASPPDENGRCCAIAHVDAARIRRQGVILHIYAGKCTTFFSVDVDGEVRTFGMGRNSCGELGSGCSDPVMKDPIELKSLKGYRWLDIQGGDWFSVGLGCDGSIFSWGHKEYVGQGSKIATGSRHVLVPKIVVGLKQKARAIGVGNRTAYVTTTDGQLFAWGDNQTSQIGNGEDTDEIELKPTLVRPALFGCGFVLQVAGGAQHAIGLVKPAPLVSERGLKRRIRDLGEEVEMEVESKRPRLLPLTAAATPSFLEETSARPAIVLPEDIMEDREPVGEESLLPRKESSESESILQTPTHRPPTGVIPEDAALSDTVPHIIKRPKPAPREASSPQLSTAARHQKDIELSQDLGSQGDVPIALEQEETGAMSDDERSPGDSSLEAEETDVKKPVPKAAAPKRQATRSMKKPVAGAAVPKTKAKAAPKRNTSVEVEDAAAIEKKRPAVKKATAAPKRATRTKSKAAEVVEETAEPVAAPVAGRTRKRSAPEVKIPAPSARKPSPEPTAPKTRAASKKGGKAAAEPVALKPSTRSRKPPTATKEVTTEAAPPSRGTRSTTKK